MATTHRFNKRLFIVAGLLPALGVAAEVKFAADAGVGASDNITRTVNGKSETMAQVGTQLTVTESSRRLAFNLGADLSYIDYLGGTYSGELLGNVNANALVRLIPDNFEWALQESFGQTRLNLFAVATPANRENINTVSTGPRIKVNLGSTLTLALNGNYARTDYQTSLLGTQRIGGDLGLEHALSGDALIAVRAAHNQVDPLSGLAGNSYSTQSAYLNYVLKGALTNVNLDLGGSRVQRTGATQNGPVARLSVDRKIGRNSTFSFGAGREFTDQGSLFGANGISSLGQAITPISNSQLSTQAINRSTSAFQHTSVNLGWLIQGRRTSIRLSGVWSDDVYDGQAALDRRRWTTAAFLSRQFGARLSGTVNASYGDDNYKLSGAGLKETSYGANLAWRVGRTIFIEAAYEGQRSQSQGAAQPLQSLSAGVSENRVWLKLRYSGDTAR
jgi:hypothetical protein